MPPFLIITKMDFFQAAVTAGFSFVIIILVAILKNLLKAVAWQATVNIRLDDNTDAINRNFTERAVLLSENNARHNEATRALNENREAINAHEVRLVKLEVIRDLKTI